MEKVTKKEVEKAIKAYNAAKLRKAAIESEIDAAQQVITVYSLANIGQFIDSRLAMDNGVIGIKAGTAKPVSVDGDKALSTAARAALAIALPKTYVKLAIDATGLYKSTDKKVRQILASQGVKIVRDDKYIVL